MARDKSTASGRKRTPSAKAATTMRTLAQKHGPTMIDALSDIALNGKSETARIAAIRELLDRGYGKVKAPQELPEPEESPLLSSPHLVIKRISHPLKTSSS
ncbi:hypothetical protein GS501_04700 [Saccharibacter sp. 17.LH.SD]|uniref:hypothetical protein n=1 Tax=Saccharibacter sp. 17.LH.SD TaxID=2689393 RepID=UPI001371A99D|nr:hypothetical protein [Saccharibacter sp. 17.LH.SD]MXV44345.1 hypothetical protein [Saccharibacter sp. 17.LH.SD]